MSGLLIAACLAVALVVQVVLSLIGPRVAHVIDPFVVVVVYFALRHGETTGMLVGTAGGWIQDLHFSGPVLGLSALSKLVVGFCVGLVGARLFLTGGWERTAVVLGAAFLDALLFERLVSFFDLPAEPISIGLLLLRAIATALLGGAVFALLDRRILMGSRR